MADDEDLRDPMVDDTPAEEVTCSGTIGIRMPAVLRRVRDHVGE